MTIPPPPLPHPLQNLHPRRRHHHPRRLQVDLLHRPRLQKGLKSTWTQNIQTLRPGGRPGPGRGCGLTVFSFRVRDLVVLLIKSVQVGELRQELEDSVPVVVQRGHLTAVQVQTLQVLEALLQEETQRK